MACKHDDPRCDACRPNAVCKNCGGKVTHHNGRWDAEFCAHCDTWLEGPCNCGPEDGCYYRGRPEKPSMIYLDVFEALAGNRPYLWGDDLQEVEARMDAVFEKLNMREQNRAGEMVYEYDVAAGWVASPDGKRWRAHRREVMRMNAKQRKVCLKNPAMSKRMFYWEAQREKDGLGTMGTARTERGAKCAATRWYKGYDE